MRSSFRRARLVACGVLAMLATIASAEPAGAQAAAYPAMAGKWQLGGFDEAGNYGFAKAPQFGGQLRPLSGARARSLADLAR